jgi:general stress protein CsbA
MFILRGFVYLFAVAGVAQLVSLEGYQSLTAAEYSEQTLTEHMQDFMSFFSCMLFLYAARVDAKLNIAATLLGALLAMMFVRESDAVLDTYVFDGAWQTIVGMIFICVLVFLWGRFTSIYASLKEYSLQSSFGTFLAGFVTILAFSRLMGRSSFWQAVMGDSYMRIVKNIVEEGIETLGYTLILISAVELVIACRKRNKPAKAKHN